MFSFDLFFGLILYFRALLKTANQNPRNIPPVTDFCINLSGYINLSFLYSFWCLQLSASLQRNVSNWWISLSKTISKTKREPFNCQRPLNSSFPIHDLTNAVNQGDYAVCESLYYKTKRSMNLWSFPTE